MSSMNLNQARAGDEVNGQRDMTEDGRGYRRPVEEVARAIWAARVARCAEQNIYLEAYDEAPFGKTTGDPSHRVSAMNDVVGEAAAALETLRSLGFISDLGISAMNAESHNDPVAPYNIVRPGED